MTMKSCISQLASTGQLEKYFESHVGDPSKYTLDVYDNNQLLKGQIKITFEERGRLGYFLKGPTVSNIKVKTKEPASAPEGLANFLKEVNNNYLAFVSYNGPGTHIYGTRNVPVVDATIDVPEHKKINFKLDDGVDVSSFSRKTTPDKKTFLSYVDTDPIDFKVAAVSSENDTEIINKNVQSVDGDMISIAFQLELAGSPDNEQILKRCKKIYPIGDIVIDKIEMASQIEDRIELKKGESLSSNFTYDGINEMYVIFPENATGRDDITVKLERVNDANEYQLCVLSRKHANVFDEIANVYGWKNETGNAIDFDTIISQLTQIEKGRDD